MDATDWENPNATHCRWPESNQVQLFWMGSEFNTADELAGLTLEKDPFKQFDGNQLLNVSSRSAFQRPRAYAFHAITDDDDVSVPESPLAFLSTKEFHCWSPESVRQVREGLTAASKKQLKSITMIAVITIILVSITDINLFE